MHMDKTGQYIRMHEEAQYLITMAWHLQLFYHLNEYKTKQINIMLYQVRKVKCLHSSALLLFVRLILDGILGVGMGCGGVHVFTCRFSVVDRRLYTSFTNLLILWPQYNTWALFCWDSSSFGSTSLLFKVLALHPNSNAFTPLILGSYKRLDLQSPM